MGDQKMIPQTSRAKKEAIYKEPRVRCVSAFSTEIWDDTEEWIKNSEGKGFF